MDDNLPTTMAETQAEESVGTVPPLRPFVPPPAPLLTVLEKPRVAHPLRLVLASIALGGAADGLLYSQGIGFGFSVFVVILVATFAILGRSEPSAAPRGRVVFPLAALLVFFAVMVSVRANGFLTFFNIAACLVIAPLLAYFYKGGNLATFSLMGFTFAPVEFWARTLFSAAPAVREARREAVASRGPGGNKKRYLPLLRGVLLATPVLVVFITLLASADELFSRAVSQFFGWLLPTELGERAWRFALATGAAWLIAGGLTFGLTRRTNDEPLILFRADDQLGFVESMTVLGSVTAVFAAFVAIQFTYLFGGDDRVLRVPGLTYAEYARHGFGELLGVAVLTLVLVLGLQAATRRESRTQTSVFGGVATLSVALTQILLVSAWQRMSVYGVAYGATELRLYVDVFIIWLGMALAWLIVALWVNRRLFPVGAFACALGFAATVNGINPDATIARENFERYRATGKLDERYTISQLSEDAVPELVAALKTTTGHVHRRIAGRLRVSLTELETQRETHGWPAHHFSRDRAYRLIKAQEALLPPQEEATISQYSD